MAAGEKAVYRGRWLAIVINYVYTQDGLIWWVLHRGDVMIVLTARIKMFWHVLA